MARALTAPELVGRLRVGSIRAGPYAQAMASVQRRRLKETAPPKKRRAQRTFREYTGAEVYMRGGKIASSCVGRRSPSLGPRRPTIQREPRFPSVTAFPWLRDALLERCTQALALRRSGDAFLGMRQGQNKQDQSTGAPCGHRGPAQ